MYSEGGKENKCRRKAAEKILKNRGLLNCMEKRQSELTVITKTKELSSYIITITQRSPKQFRFTFISKMQNLCLDCIECLYRANDTYVAFGDQKAWDTRIDYQHKAMTSLKLLGYISLLAMENKCILPKQYEQISRMSSECRNLLGGWMNSDRRRFQPRPGCSPGI